MGQIKNHGKRGLIMPDVIVFGYGLIGKYVSLHLAKRGINVTVIDQEKKHSEHQNITFVQTNAYDYVTNIVENDFVINLLPGQFGHEIRKELISRKITLVDVAFSHELPHSLDGYAKEVGSSVIWDVGIAPGLSNMLVADALQELGHLDSVNIMVGGNPLEPDDNWSYMAPFSPVDVIEEYTRPARILQDGNITMVPALSEKIEIQHDKLGILEGWITDGLRSLVENIACTDMKEYTLRWPGHIEKWLRSKDDFVLAELLDEWKFDPMVKEFTWLRVEASGNDSTIVWDVFDKGADDGSSMSRTTGLVTAATLVYLLEVDNQMEPGVFAPEQTSRRLRKFVQEYLLQHDVEISRQNLTISE